MCIHCEGVTPEDDRRVVHRFMELMAAVINRVQADYLTEPVEPADIRIDAYVCNPRKCKTAQDAADPGWADLTDLTDD